MPSSSDVTLTDALADPGGIFGSPRQLLDSDLSDPIKMELLKRWAYDVCQEDRATGEGMPPGRDALRVTQCDIADAIRQLHASQTIRRSWTHLHGRPDTFDEERKFPPDWV